MKVSGGDYIHHLRNETENWGELTFAKICGIVTVTAEEPVSRKSRELFVPGKLFCGTVFIQDQSFNNFENDTTKLWVDEAKVIVLWSRN